ncbi:MAG: energy transducer TonB [Gemmatimonadales bacterium]
MTFHPIAGRAVIALLGTLAAGSTLAAQTVVTKLPNGTEVRRRCEPATPRKDLPPVTDLFDRDSVLAVLAPAPAGGPVRISVGYGPGRPDPRLRWIEPETGPDSLLGALAAALRPRQVDAVWAYRLKLDKNGQLTIEPALYCPPIPAQPMDGPGRGTVVVEQGDRMPTNGQTIRIILEMTVDESGRASDVRLVRGSGIRSMDEEFVQRALTTRYLPAEIDGIPVPVRHRSDGMRIRG